MVVAASGVEAAPERQRACDEPKVNEETRLHARVRAFGVAYKVWRGMQGEGASAVQRNTGVYKGTGADVGSSCVPDLESFIAIVSWCAKSARARADVSECVSECVSEAGREGGRE